MKHIAVFIGILVFSFNSCVSKKPQEISSKTTLNTLLDKSISIRAIAVSPEYVWYAGNGNRVGRIDLKTNEAKEITILHDTVAAEFRSIAKTKDAIYVAPIANPGYVYKLSLDLETKELVFEENNNKIFFDSMFFRDSNNGLIVSDPIADVLHLVSTNSAGKTWETIDTKLLPKTVEGEACFAASNSNIVYKDDNYWIVTGGKKARVFHSDAQLKNWQVYDTPIVQGETMTGIYSVDFYDSKNGIIVGGNHDKPEQNFDNKAITSDGGKTWNLVAQNQGFGSASCVQYVPESKAKKIVSVGKTGVWMSVNAGLDWKQLSENDVFYTIRFIDKNTAILAGKNKIMKLIID